MFFVLLFTFALAQETTDSCGASCTWTYADGLLEITGSGEMTDYNSFNYVYPPWYDKREQITKIVVGEGITTIGAYAFYAHNTVASITLPSTLTKLKENSFAFCMSLKSLVIPKSVGFIEKYAFRGCTVLETLKYDGISNPKNCTESTFYDCKALKNVTVPAQFNVNAEAFCTIKKLIAENIDQGGSCGKECTWNFVSAEKTINIAGTGAITNYKINRSFSYLLRSYLTTVHIDEGITTVGNHTFVGCTKLKTVTMPQSITLIGESAFYKCKSLTEVVIPANVATIFTQAFANCTKLVKVSYEGLKNPACDSTVFTNSTNVTSVYIPSQYYQSATAFCGIKNVQTEVKDQVGTCGTGCSWNYTAETKKLLIFGDKEIQSFTAGRQPWFLLEKNIIETEVADGITAIGNYSFYNLTAMESVSIGKDVAYIEENAFQNCAALKTLSYNGELEPECSNATFTDSKLVVEASVPYDYVDTDFCGFGVVQRPDEVNVGLIVGLSVGGALLFVIIVVAVVLGVFIYMKKRKTSQYSDLNGEIR